MAIFIFVFTAIGLGVRIYRIWLTVQGLPIADSRGDCEVI